MLFVLIVFAWLLLNTYFALLICALDGPGPDRAIDVLAIFVCGIVTPFGLLGIKKIIKIFKNHLTKK